MYTRVLVPLDGSKLAEEILPLAERVGSDFDIPLHLLTVIKQDSVAAMRAAGSDASQKAAQKALDYLNAVSERVSGRTCPSGRRRISTRLLFRLTGQGWPNRRSRMPRRWPKG